MDLNNVSGGIAGGQPPKKSVLPIILVLILLIGIGVGCYFIGFNANKKSSECSCNNTDASDKSSDNTSDKTTIENCGVDGENETKTTKVAAGNDTNTSGKTIVDTKTKTVILNGQSYELKMELLKGSGDDKPYYKNVYLNGHKFVSDQRMIFGSVTEITDAMIENNTKTEMESARVISDTSNNTEYMIFVGDSDNWNVDMYIIDASGKTIGKLLFKMSGTGISVEGNDKYNGTLAYVDGKYIYQLGETEIKNANKNDSPNCKTEADSLTELKYWVEDGSLKNEVNKVFKKSDGYNFVEAGQGLCWS